MEALLTTGRVTLHRLWELLQTQGGASSDLVGSVVMLDRDSLEAATIGDSQDRVYVQFFDSTVKDVFNPAAAAPHISGHWLRRHTISGSGTLAQRDAAAWGDAQNGQYWLQTDVTPNLVWWWLSDLDNFEDPFWREAGHIGYAWTTTNGGTVYWQVDEIEPNALQMGALNGPMLTTDDTLPLKDLAAFFGMGRNVFMPAGYYTITDTITLKTLSSNVFRGEGARNEYGTWIIADFDDNCIEISEIAGTTGFRGSLRDFGLVGVGNTADGIHSLLTSGNAIRYTEWSGLEIYAQRHAFYLPREYSFTLRNCIGVSIDDGCGFAVEGGVGTAFIQCQGGATGTLTAAFRLAQTGGFYSCNSVVTGEGSAHADIAFEIGAYGSVSSTAQAGGATTITLNAGTTFVTDQPMGRDIVLTSGTGSGQTRRITAYNSSTKVATVDTAWGTNPANGTGYTIQDPISFMRGQPSSPSSNVLINCNCESFGVWGIRTVGDTSISIISCSFPGGDGGNYRSAMRFSPDIDDASVVVINPLFIHDLGTHSDPADIVAEGAAGLKGYIGWSDGVYNVVTAKVEKFGPSTSTTVANLPPAGNMSTGTRGFVTDATSTTFHSTVAGGGANKVPVVTDGTNWLIG